MANEVNVDPSLVNQAYKQLLADSQGQVAFLQAAATQLQNEVHGLTRENETLKAENRSLMAQTGRQDGIPQEESSPVTA